jgi:DNA-binding XRE family transcriptional regulator
VSKRHPNWRRVKKHLNYTVEEIAQLLGLHKNTVHAMRRNGLQPIDDRRPMLFLGSALANLLRERRKKGKRPLRFGEMFCLRCRDARQPAFAEVESVSQTAYSANLRGLCPKCSSLMHRRVSLARVHAIPVEWQDAIRQGRERLRDCGNPSLNCDLGKARKA